jgi:hypothetical protein
MERTGEAMKMYKTFHGEGTTAQGKSHELNEGGSKMRALNNSGEYNGGILNEDKEHIENSIIWQSRLL